jgi:hypothetical protein
MRRLRTFAAAVLSAGATAFLLFGASGSPPASDARIFVPGEVLLKFKPSATAASKALALTMLRSRALASSPPSTSISSASPLKRRSRRPSKPSDVIPTWPSFSRIISIGPA